MTIVKVNAHFFQFQAQHELSLEQNSKFNTVVALHTWSSHFPSPLTYAPVYVQPSDNSVINFLQRIVRNVTGRVLKVERMICRVPRVRGQILRSGSKTRNCVVTHCWPEVCPGTLVSVKSDSYDADTENQTNSFLVVHV